MEMNFIKFISILIKLFFNLKKKNVFILILFYIKKYKKLLIFVLFLELREERLELSRFFSSDPKSDTSTISDTPVLIKISTKLL